MSELDFYYTSAIHHDTYPAINPTIHPTSYSKHVFVTGASRGVGRAISIAYAKSGVAAIAIAARSCLDNVEEEIKRTAEAAGCNAPRVLKIHLNVTDEVSVAAAALKVKEAFGRLDVLINNAGHCEEWVELANSKIQDWWMTWEVNVRGPYLLTRALLPMMLVEGEKIIVNIGSVGAHCKFPGASSYQISKFALMRFTEFIMTDYGAQGIVAHTVHPGGVATDMSLRMPESYHIYLNDTPELAGNTVVWLTRERREWLAGRYISVNWDVEELLTRKDDIVGSDKLKMRMVL
ncbi:putative oxidoreductase, short chain dehydrogenase/reductase family [Aspergillus nomiae NRRL 13137]|uniref:Putative oxidoreductase, short chain dehydrogenase/reductase family n=1 Tax=Aspergillus nomiae NRRL (strain ATCC 15546 / NRRL 13137 / CBS 260.88 / M93) TaxID=1509407 RepID=A0A0L1JAU8_ASPN3|nr:putative oxidoreductase, short chain dehydrogenase/reductase family [Aspergillus nomiae NRRL 13137]KNG88842.1 putative oxidoreductase, short chain dehydrogenase/reductase family [Aspergillus nomiae NRRL 13137]